jgi:predicted phosphodiesterase
LQTTTEEVVLDEELADCRDALVVCGHTHIPTLMRYGEATIVNFGAVSIPGNDQCQNARYGLIDITGKRCSFNFREAVYDSRQFIADMESRKYPGIAQIREKYGW